MDMITLIGDPGGGLEPMTIPVGDFWVPARPMPQPRIKARLVKVKKGTDFIQIYTPDNKAKDHTNWRKEIWRAAQMVLPDEEIDEPVVLTVTIYVQRPKSMMGPKFFDGPIPHPSRGDLSNFIKAVEDALNPIPESKTRDRRRGFWKDDARVFCGHNMKFYTAKGKPPGAYILVETIDPDSQVLLKPQGTLFEDK